MTPLWNLDTNKTAPVLQPIADPERRKTPAEVATEARAERERNMRLESAAAERARRIAERQAAQAAEADEDDLLEQDAAPPSADSSEVFDDPANDPASLLEVGGEDGDEDELLAELLAAEAEIDGEVETETPTEQTPIEMLAEDVNCPHCPKVCGSPLGLLSHIRAKHPEHAAVKDE